MRHLLILLSFIGCANAEPWDTTDKVLGTAAVATIIVDWGQTRYIAKHPDQYDENNIILGKHPSVEKVNAYFVGYIASTLLIADWLSTPNRKLFLGVISVFEIAVTAHNRSIGLKVAF
jgi:hypothetical protein